MIKVDDYIEGYEHFGHTVKKVKGWVDKIKTEGNETIYDIQADDNWHGARGTMIFSSLGAVTFINENYPRPSYR